MFINNNKLRYWFAKSSLTRDSNWIDIILGGEMQTLSLNRWTALTRLNLRTVPYYAGLGSKIAKRPLTMTFVNDSMQTLKDTLKLDRRRWQRGVRKMAWIGIYKFGYKSKYTELNGPGLDNIYFILVIDSWCTPLVDQEIYNISRD